MSRKTVEPGAVFGRLTIVSLQRKGAVNSLDVFACTCNCGGTTTARRTDLINGHKRSCGCLAREAKHRVAKAAFEK